MKSLRIIVPVLAAATLAVPALAIDGSSAESGRKLSTTLSGAAEVPGPGDANGRGSFEARVNPGQGSLCYTLTYSNIDTATAAHIHLGGPTVAGPVSLGLRVEADGSVEDCVRVSRELAQELIQNPGNYYVNVHNAAFPAGAVRGQLAK